MHGEIQSNAKAVWEAAALKLLKGKPLESLTKSALSGLKTQVVYFDRPPEYHSDHRCEETWDSVEMQGRVAARFQSGCNFTGGIGKGIVRLYAGDDLPPNAERIEIVGLSLEQQIEMIQNNPSHIMHVDPFAQVLHSASPSCSHSTEILMNELIEQSKRHSNRHPVTIDASMLSDLGGTAKEELIWILMSLAEYSKRGVEWNQIWVHCSTTANIMEMVVKFRTLRRLLKGLAQQLRYPSQTPYLCAETSIRTFSRADQHNNMLRSLYASVGAVWGGVDGLVVHGYDVLTSASDHAHRIGQNMHSVLKEESGLDNWLDPLFGSYQIERQTEDLCTQVWSEFVSLQEKGGLLSVIQGDFQQRLQAVKTRRHELTDTGKLSITGVTDFANPMERLGTEWIETTSGVFTRDSERLEIVRARFEALPGVNVQIQCLGSLASYKPRLEYIQQLLATVGLMGDIVSEFDESASVCCLVGSSDGYETALSSMLFKSVNQPTWVVGQIPEHVATEFSVQAIHKGINTMRLWTELLNDLAVMADQDTGGEA